MKINMDQLTRQGIDAVRHGQTAAGRGYLEQAVKVDPKNAIAELWLASIASDDIEHRRHLERVLELDPDHPFALRDLAELNGQPPPRRPRDVASATGAAPSSPAGPKPISTPPELRTMTPIATAPRAVLQAIRETPAPSASPGGPRTPAMPKPTKPAAMPPAAGLAGASAAGLMPPPIKPDNHPVKPAEQRPPAAAPATPPAPTGSSTFTRPAIAQKPGVAPEAGKMEDGALWSSLMTADDAVAIANRPRPSRPAEAEPAARRQAGGQPAARTYESPAGKPGLRRPYEAPNKAPDGTLGAAGLVAGTGVLAAGATGAPAIGKPGLDTPVLGKPSGAVPTFERPRATPAATEAEAEPGEDDAATEADDRAPTTRMSPGRVALIVALLCAAFMIGALGRHLLGPRSQARGSDDMPALNGALAPRSGATAAPAAAESEARAGSAQQPDGDQPPAPGEVAAASGQLGTSADEPQASGQSEAAAGEPEANGEPVVPVGESQANTDAAASAAEPQANAQPAAPAEPAAASDPPPAARDTAEEALGTAFLSGPAITGADIDPMTVIPVWPDAFATSGASTCALPPASPVLVLDISVSAGGERAFKVQYRECVGWVAEGYLSSTRGAAQELPADIRNAEPGK